MKVLRFLLFPITVLYGMVVWCRNLLFDYGILKSKSYDFPIIVIGNLSVGGTGKTPMTAYVLDVLGAAYKTGVLSRGYKRKSEGFVLADNAVTADEIGDEPYQLYSDFPEAIVAVDADRQHGIATLKEKNKLPEVLILDDAYQHRKVKAGFYALLTTYDKLYINDFMLPTGNLRDTKNQAKRASCIIVTKCPHNITEDDKAKVKHKLGANQPVYFTTISYSDTVVNEHSEIPLKNFKDKVFTLVTGIAKPVYLVNHLKSEGLQFNHLDFPDHHNFTDKEIALLAEQECIITTQKDYVRIKDKISKVYYLPIKTKFLGAEEAFVNQLHEFISSYK